MAEKDQNTEQAILQAARKVFNQKGLDGATVQVIADEAGTTKSMVNYYFRSKEKLFAAVFLSAFRHFFSGIAAFIQSDFSLKEKIEKIVELDTQKLIEFPQLPVFILNEINRNGEIVFAHLQELNPGNLFAIIDQQIDSEVKKGTIRKIKAYELFMSIQGLTIFPILCKPLMSKILGATELEYDNILLERKKMIVEMIWKYLSV